LELFLLLALLRLFFLRQVMPDDTAGRCANDGMVSRHVTRNGTHGSPLQATLRVCRRNPENQPDCCCCHD